MRMILFIILEIGGFFFLLSFIKVILFHHFPEKIKFSFKKKRLPPILKKRKIDKLISRHHFEYIGIRTEQIFKFFKTKYYIYKNDKNVYLDVSKSNNFYYFSYKKDKVTMLFEKYQFKDYNIDMINLDLYLGENFEEAQDIDRVEISKVFYKNVKLLPQSVVLFSYMMFIFYIIQFIYMFIKLV